jgi:hypothetical protein
MIVTNFFQALQAGKELASAETWKQAQVRTNALVVILMAAVGVAKILGYSIPLDEAGANYIALGIGAVVSTLGLFNTTATVVSTTRIGVRPRGDTVQPGRTDNPRDGGVEGAVGSNSSDDGKVQVLTNMDYKG